MHFYPVSAPLISRRLNPHLSQCYTATKIKTLKNCKDYRFIGGLSENEEEERGAGGDRGEKTGLRQGCCRASGYLAVGREWRFLRVGSDAGDKDLRGMGCR